jgi:hypothetical protein
MPDATHTAKTVTIPADVVIDAAAALYAVVRVAAIVNADNDPPDELTGRFDVAADKLMVAAFPTGGRDIDQIPEWRAYLAASHDRAADLIDAILSEGGPIAGRLLGFDQWHIDRERVWAVEFGGDAHV